MILYGYALSSASYRVRIALALKGLQVTSVQVNLRAGEQRLEEFLQINNQGFVPALVLDDGAVAESGPHSTLMARDGVYRRLLNDPSRTIHDQWA